MREHHKRAIGRVAERFRDDPCHTAVIVGGSVAKGLGREDADIDVVLVASDEEYARRQAQQKYSYYDPELCDYPGGYVDGKVELAPAPATDPGLVESWLTRSS